MSDKMVKNYECLGRIRVLFRTPNIFTKYLGFIGYLIRYDLDLYILYSNKDEYDDLTEPEFLWLISDGTWHLHKIFEHARMIGSYQILMGQDVEIYDEEGSRISDEDIINMGLQANFFKNLRIYNHYSINALSKYSNLSRNTLYKLERDNLDPSRINDETLVKLSIALGRSIKSFYRDFKIFFKIS